MCRQDTNPLRNIIGDNAKFPVNKYNSRYDVLQVYLSPKWNWYDEPCFTRISTDDARGIYVIKSEDADEIVGFQIFDHHKNVAKARELYPQYDFSLPNN